MPASPTIRPLAIFAPLLALAVALLLTLPARTLAQSPGESCRPAKAASASRAQSARLCTPTSRSATKGKVKKTHAKKHKHSTAHKKHLRKGRRLSPACEEEGLLPAEACEAGQEAPSCEECEAASNGVPGPESGASICEDGSLPIVEGPGEVSCDDGSEPTCPTAGPNISSPQAFVASVAACMAHLGHEGPEFEGAA